MTERRLISTGSSFEELAGYSRAVVDGDWVFVSGTTGFDYASGDIADDVVEQTHQTFRNVEAALAEAGCPSDRGKEVEMNLKKPRLAPATVEGTDRRGLKTKTRS